MSKIINIKTPVVATLVAGAFQGHGVMIQRQYQMKIRAIEGMNLLGKNKGEKYRQLVIAHAVEIIKSTKDIDITTDNMPTFVSLLCGLINPSVFKTFFKREKFTVNEEIDEKEKDALIEAVIEINEKINEISESESESDITYQMLSDMLNNEIANELKKKIPKAKRVSSPKVVVNKPKNKSAKAMKKINQRKAHKKNMSDIGEIARMSREKKELNNKKLEEHLEKGGTLISERGDTVALVDGIATIRFYIDGRVGDETALFLWEYLHTFQIQQDTITMSI